MAAVLVVDDHDDIRDLISLCLCRSGHDVTSVGEPDVALALAGSASFDIAILDWSMPVMDGGQLCRRLRLLPHLAEVPVLVVTAHSDEHTRRQAVHAGASSLLAKPFSLRDLGRVVDGLLTLHAADSASNAGSASFENLAAVGEG